MYKIFLSVRNRLAITKKCIAALQKHSELEHQIYVYDNCTSHEIEQHFLFFSELYKNNLISQVTFNTTDSTFNCFSKAVSSNQFGLNHEMDPYKDRVQFLVFLDNDILVAPGWDTIIANAWDDVKKEKNTYNIKIITQYSGNIKDDTDLIGKMFGGYPARIGVRGGSALWALRNNFFTDVGFLDIRNVYGINKRHDSEYWKLLSKSSGGKPYILGLKTIIGTHCDQYIGSICNILSNRLLDNKEDMIKFNEAERNIDIMSFDDFYAMVVGNCKC